jgi:uncharacterized protein
MRLSADERAALDHALAGIDGKAYLFGSRARDDARGGDIDVLILTDSPSFETSRAVSIEFFKRCEEKIDVVAMNPKLLSDEQKAFLRLIDRDKVELK